MKCVKCNKEATGRLSPDLDIKGIPFCQEHEKLVRIAYLVLVTEGEEEFKSILEIE